MHHPTIGEALAKDRIRSLHRAGARARLGARAAKSAPLSSAREIVIRDAQPHDADALARLSHLDGKAVPRGRVVVASVRGRLQAAVGADGHAVSDPFAPTDDLLALLRLRVHQLRAH
jgi:hypothetical protein